MTWERKASEWDEGWASYDQQYESQQRSERSKKSALARQYKTQGNRLLEGALKSAVKDRLSLLSCYAEGDPQIETLRRQIEGIRSLSGKPLDALTEDESSLAFKAFVWAEQWHDSVADAHGNEGSVAIAESRRSDLLRVFRTRHWGKTVLETIYDQKGNTAPKQLVALPVHKDHP